MNSSKLLFPFLFVGLLFSIMSFTLPRKGITNTDINKTISLGPEKQVGQNGASTVFSFYSTSPESPDGKYIFHLRCKKEPDDKSLLVPGELWICNHDLKKYRHLTDVKGMPAHNGAEAQWLDNKYIALHDSGIIRVIDIRNGKDILKKRIETPGIGHDSFKGKVLFTVLKENGTERPGIYELNCFTGEVRSVKLITDFRNAILPSYINPDEVFPVEQWRVLHLQYSPDGKKIAFRLDVGKTEPMQLLGLCNVDGSDIEIQTRSLHFLWYDNESIIGHINFNKQGERPQQEKRFNLTRWDAKGNYIETLAPRGNHLAISPDRKYFVDETFYQTDPVIMYLISKEQKNRITVIDSFPPYDLVWKKRFHVNPAFSRDGKRIYYSKPLNEKFNGTFYREIKYQ